MVFTITTYYKHVRRHLYGVYHHKLLQSCKKAPLWCLPSQPVRRHLYGVYHHNLLEGTSMVFTITIYYNPVRRHLYGVFTMTTC